MDHSAAVLTRASLDGLPIGLLLLDDTGRVLHANPRAASYAASSPVGQSCHDFLGRARVRCDECHFSRPRGASGSARLCTKLDRGVAEFPGGDRWLVVLPDPQANQPGAPIAPCLRSQSVLAALGKDALECQRLQMFFDKACAAIAEVLPAEFTQILELDDASQVLRTCAGTGWQTGIVESCTLPAWPDTQAGFTLAARGPVVVEDLHRERRFAPPALFTAHQIRSGVSVVIPGTRRPFGVLGAFVQQPRAFGDADLQFLTNVAHLLGSAVHRHRIEAELCKASSAMAQTADAVVITDRNGVIKYANEAFERASGYRLEEVLGKTPRILKSDVHDAATYRAMWELLLAGQPYRGEIVNRRKDGSLFTLDKVISPWRNSEGEITHFISTDRDITERKRQDAQRIKLEAQLHQSQKMEAVGRLASGIAHDFNNLLTVILGHADLLQRGLGGSPHEASLRNIRYAAERAGDLTSQLLAFGRQQVLKPVVFRVGDLLRKLDPLLRRLIGEDITLEISVTTTRDGVLADPVRIEQAILNLAANARDAMPEGGVLKITGGRGGSVEPGAECAGEPRSGEYVAIEVRDQGTGMDVETRRRLFEPFFTTKAPGKGTGLGLASVLGIVEQSDGFVSVWSEVGRGTAIRLHLPAHAVPLPATEVAAPIRPARGTETILLTEDMEAVRALARRVLAEAGYHVLVAARPGEAIELAQAHPDPIHALVTDVVMPEMSGSALAAHIQTTRPATKVLYISGHTQDSVAVETVKRFPGRFLSKPFSPQQLREAVRSVIDAE